MSTDYKVGDKIQVKGYTNQTFTVLGLLTGGVMIDAHESAKGAIMGDLRIVHFENIVEPPKPKAKCGQGYRKSCGESYPASQPSAFGLADGRIYSRNEDRAMAFDPTRWVEVEVR